MIFDICVNVFESLIDTFFLYSLSVNHKKNTILYSVLLTVIHFCFITAVNYISVSELFLSFFYIVLYASYLALTTEKSKGEALFCACIPNVIYSVTCLALLFTLSSLLYGEIGYEPLMVEHKIPVIIFVHILQAGLFWLSARWIRRHPQMMAEPDNLIAAVSLILLSNLQTCFEGIVYIPEHTSRYMLGGIYITIVLIVLLLILFQRIHVKKVKEMKQDFELQVLNSQKENGEKILAAYDKLAEIRHDMKHFVKLLSEDSAHKEELEEIISRYQEEEHPGGFPVHSGNAIVDKVINYRREQAAAENISFICKLNITHIVQMEPADLYLLLSNLLDNAICHIGTARKIMLEMYDVRRMFMIRVTNSCDETDGENSNVSAATEKHGIGMITIRSLVEKYKGTMEADRVGNEYIVCILFNISDEAAAEVTPAL